jgi:hypothetical protein
MQTGNISCCLSMPVYGIGAKPTGNWEKSLKKSVKVLDVCIGIWDKHHTQRARAGEVVGKRSKTTEFGLTRMGESVKRLYGSSLSGVQPVRLVIKKIKNSRPGSVGQKT